MKVIEIWIIEYLKYELFENEWWQLKKATQLTVHCTQLNVPPYNMKLWLWKEWSPKCWKTIQTKKMILVNYCPGSSKWNLISQFQIYTVFSSQLSQSMHLLQPVMQASLQWHGFWRHTGDLWVIFTSMNLLFSHLRNQRRMILMQSNFCNNSENLMGACVCDLRVLF